MGERDGYASKDVSASVASATARCLDFAARRREWHPPEGMRIVIAAGSGCICSDTYIRHVADLTASAAPLQECTR